MATIHAAAFRHGRPWSIQEFASLLQQPTIFATGDSRSFALVRVVLDEAELLTIATDPIYQRQGLARTLMQSWQADAAQRGAATAFLEVAEDNLAARALYCGLGYIEAGRRPAYYPRTDGAADALLMRVPLT